MKTILAVFLVLSLGHGRRIVQVTSSAHFIGEQVHINGQVWTVVEIKP